MQTLIAFIRGINVGGKHKVPMKELVQLLQAQGLESVKTYIQTGNIVFKTATPDQSEAQIASSIETNFGFRPDVMILSHEMLHQAIADNPFSQADGEPKTLHLYFLEQPPANPDLAKLEALKAETEQFVLHTSVFYLYAPDGIGRSKLAASVEKALGVRATARNWRSVQNIFQLAESVNLAGI